MIPNFNPNKWDREKIIDYVIGEQPLSDEQLEFLNYIEQLKRENKELKKYCCKRNDCGGRIKENHKLTDSEVLTKFEKWLEEEIKKINNLINPKKGIKPYGEELNILETIRNVYMDCKDKLKELKEGRRNDT